ncbi:MAG: hypothetical protein OEM27_02545 [Nitrospinota bacterium]|nr:hypothetical protein [Nitrospinota bacterium]
MSFSHASATRSKTESVLAIAESENSCTGYGEGCPRSYVTGETLETSFQLFDAHQQQLIQIEDLNHLRSWISDHQAAIDRNPAAWCAIELALLDLLGKETEQPIESLLSLPEINGNFQYTAVLGVNSLRAFEKQFRQYLEMGFEDFKLKVSGNLKEDQEKIKLFKTPNDDKLRIRLDANNFWETPDEAVEYIKKLEHSFFAIEEPLQTGQYEDCRRIYETIKIPIILDESFNRQDQFSVLAQSPQTWMINLRVSKMGGIVRSLAIAEQADNAGIPVIVGAQVGETSILTRAALTVANACSKNVVAQEGAFGTHLLERDITLNPIMFGKCGELSVTEFSQKSGLGVEISEADLLSMTR